jgi:hypothetical protein
MTSKLDYLLAIGVLAAALALWLAGCAPTMLRHDTLCYQINTPLGPALNCADTQTWQEYIDKHGAPEPQAEPEGTGT